MLPLNYVIARSNLTWSYIYSSNSIPSSEHFTLFKVLYDISKPIRKYLPFPSTVVSCLISRIKWTVSKTVGLMFFHSIKMLQDYFFLFRRGREKKSFPCNFLWLSQKLGWKVSIIQVESEMFLCLKEAYNFQAFSQEVCILCFPGSLYFPREYDRHAITEAGPEHCYACHIHQGKMIC